MTQVQCPNCGGYDIRYKGTLLPLRCSCALLTLPLLVIPYIVLEVTYFARRDKRKFIEGENTAICKLCNFKFRIDQVPLEPIQPNIGLIAAGRKRIKEQAERDEEARRRRDRM